MTTDFPDENPAQLQTTFPLVVTDTVCGTVPTKPATVKIFLDAAEKSDREHWTEDISQKRSALRLLLSSTMLLCAIPSMSTLSQIALG